MPDEELDAFEAWLGARIERGASAAGSHAEDEQADRPGDEGQLDHAEGRRRRPRGR